MEHIFFHFLRQQSTTACGNSSFFNWNIFFSQSFIPASGNNFFVLKTVLLYSEFFCWWKLLLKLGGSQFLKTKNIFLLVNTSFFDIFEDFKIFKVEATFSYCENSFFNKSFIQLVKMDFLSSGNSVF